MSIWKNYCQYFIAGTRRYNEKEWLDDKIFTAQKNEIYH